VEPVEDMKPDTQPDIGKEEPEKTGPVHPYEPETASQEGPANYESDETVSIRKTRQHSSGDEDKTPSGKVPRGQYYRTRKMTFRTVALIVLFLVLVVVFYAGKGESVGETLGNAWRNFIVEPIKTAKASVLDSSPSVDAENNTISEMEILNNDARSEYETALMDSLEEGYVEDSPSSSLRRQLDRIAGLIDSGKLDQAESELDPFLHSYPDSPEVEDLYRQLRAAKLRADAQWIQ
jgi:hypothetical protein